MELNTIQKFLAHPQVSKNPILWLCVGSTLCLCIIVLLLVVSVALLVVVFPIVLLFGAPLQALVFALRFLGICLRQITDNIFPDAPREGNRRDGRPKTPNRLKPPGRARCISLSGSDTSYGSSPRIESASVTEDEHEDSGQGNIQQMEENTGIVYPNSVELLRTGLSISTDLTAPSPNNILGLEIVDSPMDYMHQAGRSAIQEPPSLFHTLPISILEEVLLYLPPDVVGKLALVSRSFGNQFRFRRAHSGTDYVALPTFSLIARKPSLGEHVSRLIIHPTFYRPQVRTQWMLEGSDPSTSQNNWNNAEEKKLKLLSAVIRACRRIKYLMWSEGRLLMPPVLLNTLQVRLMTTLRHLDIQADCAQLLAHLRKSSSDEFDTLRLTSLVVRGGLGESTIPDILRLITSTRNSLKSLTFIDSRLGIACDRLADTLDEFTDLKRLEFINPAELDTTQIPITSLGRQRTFSLIISCPITSFKPFHLAFSIPPSQSLTHLTSLILTFGSYTEVGDLHTLHRSPHDSPLFDVVAAAVNIRVFACNSPTVDRRVGVYYDPRMELAMPSLVPYDLIEALVTKKRLISLSLMSWTLGQNQLRMVCQRLPQLLHLAVYMPGEGKDISQYSSQFSRLQSLKALDVTISPFDTSCPCGHDLDPRIPHFVEGSAMGRLCRRMRQPTNLKIVRLSQNGWFPDSKTLLDIDKRWVYELNWIEELEDAVADFERICGPCRDENEAVRRIFSPLTWVSVG